MSKPSDSFKRFVQECAQNALSLSDLSEAKKALTGLIAMGFDPTSPMSLKEIYLDEHQDLTSDYLMQAIRVIAKDGYNSAMLEALLMEGVNPNARASEGFISPLAWSLMTGKLKAAELLDAAGAKWSFMFDKALHKSSLNIEQLKFASRATVDILLERGPTEFDQLDQTVISGNTPQKERVKRQEQRWLKLVKKGLEGIEDNPMALRSAMSSWVSCRQNLTPEGTEELLKRFESLGVSARDNLILVQPHWPLEASSLLPWEGAALMAGLHGHQASELVKRAVLQDQARAVSSKAITPTHDRLLSSFLSGLAKRVDQGAFKEEGRSKQWGKEGFRNEMALIFKDSDPTALLKNALAHPTAERPLHGLVKQSAAHGLGLFCRPDLSSREAFDETRSFWQEWIRHSGPDASWSPDLFISQWIETAGEIKSIDAHSDALDMLQSIMMDSGDEKSNKKKPTYPDEEVFKELLLRSTEIFEASPVLHHLKDNLSFKLKQYWSAQTLRVIPVEDSRLKMKQDYAEWIKTVSKLWMAEALTVESKPLIKKSIAHIEYAIVKFKKITMNQESRRLLEETELQLTVLKQTLITGIVLNKGPVKRL